MHPVLTALLVLTLAALAGVAFLAARRRRQAARNHAMQQLLAREPMSDLTPELERAWHKLLGRLGNATQHTQGAHTRRGLADRADTRASHPSAIPTTYADPNWPAALHAISHATEATPATPQDERP